MSSSINPKRTGIFTKVFSTSGPNLVALAWTGDGLSRGQAQNGVNFDFGVEFDLEGQGQSPPKTIGILTKVFYAYGPNLVILAWTGEELSRGQTWWRTDWRTDRRRQQQYPKANTGLGENTFGSTCHKILCNTSSVGFGGNIFNFLCFFFNSGHQTKIFVVVS